MSNFTHPFEDIAIEEWLYDGRPCVVTKHPSIGHYCGYVRTPYSFRPHGDTTYWNADNHIKLIEVNGGITYGPDEDGWVGFDCGHSWDVCWEEEVDEVEPLSGEFALEDDHRKDWTVEKVKEEVKSLADQLSALEQFVEAVK